MLDVVQKKMASMVEDGTIDKKIEEQLEKAINKSIEDIFCSYGDFTKKLKDEMQKVICINDDLGLPGYSELVTKIVRAQLNAHMEKQVADHVAGYIDKLLNKFPSEITISELVETFKEYVRDEEAGEDRDITFIVEDSADLDGYFDIYMSEESCKDRHSCKYMLRCKEDEVWSINVNGWRVQPSSKQLFAGALFGFEEFLFHAYTNKIKIVRDTDYIDLEITGVYE